MYLMPVTTFSDYVKASKKWTVLTGGTLVLNFLLSSLQAQKIKTSRSVGKTNMEVKVDGLVSTVEAFPADPAETLRKAGIGLGPSDIVKIAGNTIEITRVEEQFLIADSSLPYPSEEKVNRTLEPGTTKIIAQGAAGLKREVVKVTVAGGKEVGREIVQSEVVKEPVKRVVAKNPIQISTASANSTTVTRGLPDGVTAKRKLVVEATAYTHTGNKTATGATPRVGLVAVDPKVIPLGTRLFIEGYGYAVAADTGGVIKGNKIDVFLNTRSEALQWGRRNVKIYILAS